MHQQAWLFATPSDAEQLIWQWPAEKIKATPMPKAERVRKPPPVLAPDSRWDLF
jgi:hypothetical protein